MTLRRVQLEVEYVRRETVEFVHDDESDGLRDTNTPLAVGTFLRSLNFHMHHGKSLTLSESPRLVSFRFMDTDCMGPGEPNPEVHRGPWERVPGSDQAHRCAACGRVSGK